MSDNTHIEWTDATWNPITGCSVISPGCTNCYAMKLAGTRLQEHPSRIGLTNPSKAGPVWNGQVRFNKQWLDQPLRWKRPRRIFVCAHGDLFHESVPFEWIDEVFIVMTLSPQHVFQVLTKRADRMRQYMQRLVNANEDEPDSPHAFNYITGVMSHEPAPNIWLGVSVEDQRRADERIPLLLQTPAAVRWLSCEPLLGPVDLTDLDAGGVSEDVIPRDYWTAVDDDDSSPALGIDALDGIRWQRFGDWSETGNRIDWVVAGGESGKDARPMHPEWARSLRDQCQAAGVPFFFKQWGEFAEASLGNVDASREDYFLEHDGTNSTDWTIDRHTDATAHIVRIGKKAAGRLLDGREWNEYPEVPHGDDGTQ